MKNLFRIVLFTAIILTVAFPAMAQGGMTETFSWPEVGFSMSHPSGWSTGLMDESTAGLLAVPNVDVTNIDDPEADAIVVVAFPASFAAIMGSSADVMGMFTSEFGEGGEIIEIDVNGLPALYTSGYAAEDDMNFEIVMVEGPYYLYIIMGVPFEGESLANFDEMLASITVVEPTVMPDMEGMMGSGETGTSNAVLVDGVRVTVDQSIGGSWNEIDAVALVGADVDGFEVTQWAISAEATSNYGSDSWNAIQAIGQPDTEVCGDMTTAWASESSTGYDSLTTYYGMPVAASAVEIYQTYNPGSIVMVELLPTDGSAPIVIFEGVDATIDCPGVLSIPVEAMGGDMGGVYDAGPVAAGETVYSYIDDSLYMDEWSYTGTAGEVITITMLAEAGGDLDTYLYLLDPSGMEIAYNDDAEVSVSNNNLDSQIANVTLPSSGTYIIRATRYAESSGASTGNYNLTVDSGAGGAATGGKGTTAGAVGGQAVIGSSVTGTINDATPINEWTLQAAAGDVVTITMIADASGDLDTYLYLLDPNGQQIAYNDDAAVSVSTSDYDSQIVNATLPTAGTYTIQATRYGEESGATAGGYSLTVEYGAVVSAAGAIGYGEAATGAISDATPFEDWTLSGNAGDTISIAMVSDPTSTLDTYLYLIAPDGSIIIENDDADVADANMGLFDSKIANVTLPAAGEYTIRATRWGDASGATSGSYTLTVTLGK